MSFCIWKYLFHNNRLAWKTNNGTVVVQKTLINLNNFTDMSQKTSIVKLYYIIYSIAIKWTLNYAWLLPHLACYMTGQSNITIYQYLNTKIRFWNCSNIIFVEICRQSVCIESIIYKSIVNIITTKQTFFIIIISFFSGRLCHDMQRESCAGF